MYRRGEVQSFTWNSSPLSGRMPEKAQPGDCWRWHRVDRRNGEAEEEVEMESTPAEATSEALESRLDSLSPAALSRVLDQIQQVRVAVFGDVMVDRFIWGKVARISPEAPVPVVEVDRSRELDGYRLGGAANVANNLAQLGSRVSLVGILGDDEAARHCWRLLASRGIDGSGIQTVVGRPTTLKTRVVAHGQQVVRFDVEERSRLAASVIKTLEETLLRQATACQAVILSDYAKGVLEPEATRALTRTLRAEGKIVAADPKVHNIDLYAGVTVITPNRSEACSATGVWIDDPSAPRKAAERLLTRLGCEAVLVTLGEDGMYLLHQDGTEFRVSAQTAQVYDVTGAGDTVIAILTLALAAGCSWLQAVQLANAGAGVVVGKIGTAVVSREELRLALTVR